MSRLHIRTLLTSLLSLAGFAPAAQAQYVTPAMVEEENTYRVGVEYVRDNYRESSVDLSEHADFKGATAEYYHSRNGFMTGVQARASYGRDDYKSISGVIRNIPQYEGELRGITGVSIPTGGMGGVKAIIPYIGLGMRYFYDNSKGTRTASGANGYDRIITQFYVPVGGMWSFDKWGFIFSSVAEFDFLFYGKVKSKFSNFNGNAVDLNNTQRRGIGLRGEFMVGQKYEDFGWQLGPVVRYWDVNDSDLDTVGGALAGTYLEPQNTRLQAGAAFRVQF